MIIARIESFIVGKGLKDALKRAEIYSKAGADAILIHSKERHLLKFFLLQKNLEKVNILNQWYLFHLLIQKFMKKI